MKPIKIALADDHKLFRDGLTELISSFGSYQVILESDNGKDLVEHLSVDELPDLLLLDVNMPEMDGYETAAWCKEHYPEVKILALSMYDQELAVIRMVRAGVRGYILKDIRKQELKCALDAVIEKGFYYTDLVTGKLIKTIHTLGGKNNNEMAGLVTLNDREIEFLKQASSDLTYREIAAKMNLSVHTIDGYRDTLFEKLQVRSRVGLVIYAIRNNIVTV